MPRRPQPEVLQADLTALSSLQAFPTYQPANPAYAVEAVQAALEAMNRTRVAAEQAEASAAALRDDANVAALAFHNLVTGAKTQVLAQFGDDSNEVQAMGLKKRSERKRPARRSKPDAP